MMMKAPLLTTAAMPTAVEEVDRALDALLEECLGMPFAEYVSLVGVRAFHPRTKVALPLHVMDAGDVMMQLKEKQRALRALTEEAITLDRNLGILRSGLDDAENRPPPFLLATPASSGGATNRKTRDRCEVERLQVALAQRHDAIANLRHDLWCLTSPARTRVIDADAFHQRLQALLNQRVVSGIRETHAHAMDLCLARASARRHTLF